MPLDLIEIILKYESCCIKKEFPPGKKPATTWIPASPVCAISHVAVLSEHSFVISVRDLRTLTWSFVIFGPGEADGTFVEMRHIDVFGDIVEGIFAVMKQEPGHLLYEASNEAIRLNVDTEEVKVLHLFKSTGFSNLLELPRACASVRLATVVCEADLCVSRFDEDTDTHHRFPVSGDCGRFTLAAMETTDPNTIDVLMLAIELRCVTVRYSGKDTILTAKWQLLERLPPDLAYSPVRTRICTDRQEGVFTIQHLEPAPKLSGQWRSVFRHYLFDASGNPRPASAVIVPSWKKDDAFLSSTEAIVPQPYGTLAKVSVMENDGLYTTEQTEGLTSPECLLDVVHCDHRTLLFTRVYTIGVTLYIYASSKF